MKVILVLIFLQAHPNISKEIPMNSMFDCKVAANKYNEEIVIYDTFPFNVSENIYSASCIEVPTT